MKKPYKAQAKKLPEPVKLTIEGIAANGDGYGYHNNKLWYVPYTMANDIIIASPIKAMKNCYQANIQSWVSKSPNRSVPTCPFFGSCGGCKLQHLSEQDYQSWKQQQILQILKRQNINISDFDEISFLPKATRRRVTFALSKSYELSFHRHHSHQLISVNHCPVLTDEINASLPFIQNWLKQHGSPICADAQIHLCLLNKLEMTIISSKPLPLKAINAFTKLQQVPNLARLCWKQKDYEPQVIWQTSNLFAQYDDAYVQTPPMPFLQASLQGEQFLQRKILEYIGKTSTPIIDLFCGMGTFSFPLAKAYKKVHGFDIAKTTIEGAQISANEQPQLKGRITFSQRDLFKQPLLPYELKQAIVILDPPRAGAMETVEQIARSDVQHVVMVSCNPKSFSRDVHLLQRSGFHLERLSLLDQFTYAPHMELVGKLVK